VVDILFASKECALRESVHTLRVRFGETDAFGIVFYPNFFAYFDVAVAALLRASPYAFARGLQEGGFGFPIVESAARFHAPLLADDEIDIGTRVTEIRTRSVRLEHTVRRGSGIIATGFEIRAFARYSPATQKIELAEMPPDLRAWLDASAP
jgi:YbgC/YbaW family acyl-CoA thioester hydrolase